MKVIRITHPTTFVETYRLYGDDGLPLGDLNKYLVFLANRGFSPNTIRAYAYDLKEYLGYLQSIPKRFLEADLEDVVNFIQHLKYSTKPDKPDVLPVNGAQARAPASINRALAAVNSFYKYQSAQENRSLPNIEEFLVNPYGHSENAFLSFARGARPRAMRRASRPIGHQRVTQNTRPKDIPVETQKAALSACGNRRDRLLLLLLIETGLRIGQALSLRHEDIESWNTRLLIKYRPISGNGMYSKSRDEYYVSVSSDWLDYMTDFLVLDLDGIDSDYLFTTLYGSEPNAKATPLRYSAVKSLFARLSKKVGTQITPHMFRHTHATELLRAGMSLDMVAKRLGHRSVETTKKIYEHLNAEDMRRELKSHTESNTFLKSLYQGL